MPDSFVNRFGRRPGRGLRPWLLLPKLIAVCFYIGGLAAALAIWIHARLASLPPADPRRLSAIDRFSTLMEFFVVPSLLAALLFGTLLLLQHPRIFLRLRWLIVKLSALAILVPSAHFFLSSRIARLRHDCARGLPDNWAIHQVTYGLALTLAASIVIVILGRLKPRLRQNWARAYPLH